MLDQNLQIESSSGGVTPELQSGHLFDQMRGLKGSMLILTRIYRQGFQMNDATE